MANNVTGNPYTLDTTGVIIAGTTELSIDFVRWVGGTTAGHQCILMDASSAIIWRSIAPAANYVEQAPIRKRYFGLTLDTLGSGTVDVYLDMKPKRF